MKSLKRLISSVLIGIYIFTMNGNTFAINKNQNEIDSYNSAYLEEVSDFSTNQDESIYSNFEYSLNEVTPVINDVTKEKQFVFEDDIYTVVYEEQSEEFGTIYHVVKNNNSDKDEAKLNKFYIHKNHLLFTPNIFTYFSLICFKSSITLE